MAMVVRLWHLGLLTEWQYRSLCISLSQAGYRTAEPDGIPGETSQVLAKVLDLLRSEGTTRQSIAEELAITSAELNSLIAGLSLSAVPPLVARTNGTTPNAANVPTEWPKLSLVEPGRKKHSS